MPTCAEGASTASSLHDRLSATKSLLESLSAMTHWRAFLLLTSTFIASMIVATVLGAASALLMGHSGFLAGMMALTTALAVFVIVLVGINGAGIMLSDDVWERPRRGIGDAVLSSARTSHRLVVILLLEGVLFLAYLIALTVVLFLCKIPFLGPLLYAVVFPAGAILTGIVLFALMYVGIPLAAPAIWNGATVMQALATLKEAVYHRLAFAVIMILLLGVLLLVVAGILWGILAGGAGTVMSLSALVIGNSASLAGIAMSFFYAPGFGSQGSSGYVWALSFGGAVLLLIGATPGMLVGIKGMAIIHRATMDGLSLEEAEAGLNQRFADVKRRAGEATEHARTRMVALTQTGATPAAQEREESDAALCPTCHNAIATDDVFCAHCGHRLKRI